MYVCAYLPFLKWNNLELMGFKEKMAYFSTTAFKRILLKLPSWPLIISWKNALTFCYFLL